MNVYIDVEKVQQNLSMQYSLCIEIPFFQGFGAVNV